MTDIPATAQSAEVEALLRRMKDEIAFRINCAKEAPDGIARFYDEHGELVGVAFYGKPKHDG